MTAEKIITFYMDYHPEDKSIPTDVKHGYYETLDAIESGIGEIHTTQIVLLSTRLWMEGYRTFVREMDGEIFEIRLGDNERTNREIREGHNLCKMLVAGEFAKTE